MKTLGLVVATIPIASILSLAIPTAHATISYVVLDSGLALFRKK
jgi:hypothetical protein